MLEPLPFESAVENDVLPRASLVLPAGALGNRAAIWMGGARALRGVELHPHALAGAWILDAAGDISFAHRAAATRTLDCVFDDIEEAPPGYQRILQIVGHAAEAARGCQPDRPVSLFIFCAQGLNRSGLLTGLILRALGVPGREAVERIRAARPGSLANQAYERLLIEEIGRAHV